MAQTGETLRIDSRYLGIRTNNQAEYEALISALLCASQLGAEEVVAHLDSELVGKQLLGKYQVRNPELRQLWRKAVELTRLFRKVNFVNVPRTNAYIKQADKLVNKTLDEMERKR